MVFFSFPASGWRDLQSPLLVDIHLAGTYAAPPAAAEVRFDDDVTYRAHAKAVF